MPAVTGGNCLKTSELPEALSDGVDVEWRLRLRFVFHFTPTSASWLNAIEGFFASSQRSFSSEAYYDPCGNSKMPSTASSTTPTRTQNPSSGPRTQTKSSPLSDEGTKC